MTAKAEASLFRRWLLEEFSARQLGLAKTSFANKTIWCWQVQGPKPSVTGEVYDQVLLDGIYLAYGWCLITATNGEKIIAWQWCQRENSAAYQALMNRLPAPMVVVTDGGAGIAKELCLTWPESRIQPPTTDRPSQLRHRHRLQPDLPRRLPTHPQKLGQTINKPRHARQSTTFWPLTRYSSDCKATRE